MAFIPHTRDDVQHMLDVIGIDSTERLFEEIPSNLRCGELAALPAAMPEMAIGRLMSERAAQDVPLLNFIGAGAYEHHIPAAVWSLVTRGEFYSAYTPYQAEASQGTLQVIYEFQSMMTHLTGMQASNASMYDGASALAEACLMAVRAHRRSRSARILMPRTVHPYYRRCARAIVEGQALSLSDVGFDTASGCIDMNSLRALEGQDVTALVIAQPNFFGNLEDVDALTDWAHAQGALVIAVVNPISLAVLKPPGEWGAKGADIVVGEGQPLGVPLSSGGPYFGFMTTRLDMVRQMPGRVVGRTVDANGTPGFTLTLQAREQHIRRGKATSNICTNQGLVMTAATIYLSIMGASGLTRVAAASMARCQQLVATLCALPGVRRAFVGNSGFHEAVLQLDRPVAPWLQALAERGIAGGLDISAEYPELGDAVLVCATETRTTADIAAYGAAAAAVMGVRS